MMRYLASMVFSVPAGPPAQAGVSEAEQVLCTGDAPVAQLVTVGLGLASMYFFLKFLLRAQYGFDKRGDVPSGRDPTVNARKKSRFGKLQTRDALYSLLAGLVPVLVPVFLRAVGIDVVECLL